jgi:hypothetical protein
MMAHSSTLGHLVGRFCILIVLLSATVLPARAQEAGVLSASAPLADPTPPAEPVKLVFVHHSTGGNWLADPNQDQPYGGLGVALRDNNYFVSATNYGWGPDSIGDRTDIPNWPEWFTGPGSSTILDALYNESGQNIGDFGSWSRLATDPGGENEIIMFKSCFPNSDLYGNANDPPDSAPNDQFTVSNAKAVYNALLTYFETRQDKLFIVITAPPMGEGEYGSDAQPASQRAANARAFNNWLVNDWLAGYPYSNVAVFDYYNVLTSNGSSGRTDSPGTNEEPNDADREDGNHHRWWNDAVQHVQTVENDFSAYPTDSSWDSHPTTAGHQKATSEFVPLLNVYYNRWRAGAAAPRSMPTATPEQAEQATPTPKGEVEPIPTTPSESQPTQAPAAAGIPAAPDIIDDMEAEDYWSSYGDDQGSTVTSRFDTETAHSGSASLRIEFDIRPEGWGDTGFSHDSPQDWSGGYGISLWLRSDGAGKPLALVLLAGNPEAPTPFTTHFETTAESTADWAQFVFSWADFTRAEWADEGGLATLDPTQVLALGFNFSPSQGVIWVDDIGLASGEAQPQLLEEEEKEETTPTATTAPEEAPPAATPEPAEPAEPAEPGEPAESKGGPCASAAVLPLAVVTTAWVTRKRRAP